MRFTSGVKEGARSLVLLEDREILLDRDGNSTLYGLLGLWPSLSALCFECRLGGTQNASFSSFHSFSDSMGNRVPGNTIGRVGQKLEEVESGNGDTSEEMMYLQ